MIKRYGNKDEVFDGEAIQTKGGLTKRDLIINSRGFVVSKRQQENGRKNSSFLRSKTVTTPIEDSEDFTDSE